MNLPDKDGWQVVSFAADCGIDPADGEFNPNCSICGDEYTNCNCPGPGPTQDGYEYKLVDDVMMARNLESRLKALAKTAKSTGNLALQTDTGLCLAVCSQEPNTIYEYALHEMGIRTTINITDDALYIATKEQHGTNAITRAIRGSFSYVMASNSTGKQAIKIYIPKLFNHPKSIEP